MSAPLFEDVYREHAAYVLHTLRRFGVAERHLPDVAHDVFIAVHRHLGSFDTSRPLKPWLAGFCFRTSHDHRRLAVQRNEHLDDEGAPDAKITRGPEDDAFASEARRRVLRALGELHEDQRAVLVLHDLDELGAPAIAEALGIPLNTAYSRLRLARRDFLAAARRLGWKGGGS